MCTALRGDADCRDETALSLRPFVLSRCCVRCAQKHGDASAALESFETALAMDPCCSDAHIDTARLLRQRATPEDLTLAHMHLRAAIAAEADRYAAWQELGLVQQQQGALIDAERSLRTAAALAVTSPVLSWSELTRTF